MGDIPVITVSEASTVNRVTTEIWKRHLKFQAALNAITANTVVKEEWMERKDKETQVSSGSSWISETVIDVKKSADGLTYSVLIERYAGTHDSNGKLLTEKIEYREDTYSVNVQGGATLMSSVPASPPPCEGAQN